MLKKKTRTPGRPRKSDIVPFEKQLPITSPETIPGDAPLDVYEKMAAKMALSKDEIIDRALDNLEGKPETKPVQHKAENTPPAEDDKTEDKPQKQSKSGDAEGMVNYNAMWVERGEIIKELKKEMADLKDELAGCKKENESLKSQISHYQDGTLKSEFQTELDELVNKNDDLILKNSELEFEISRLGAENTKLRQQLEQDINAKMLPPQTNTTEAYTRFNNSQPSQPKTRRERLIQQQMMINRSLTPLRRGMNGYESWN